MLKSADLLQKNTDIGKIKGVLVLKGIFTKTTYLYVLTYLLSNFPPPHTPQNEPLKSSPRLVLKEVKTLLQIVIRYYKSEIISEFLKFLQKNLLI